MRKFTPPWTVEDIGTAFKVTDASGQNLGYFYYRTEETARSAAHALTRDQARRLAVNFAKLPTLLKAAGG